MKWNVSRSVVTNHLSHRGSPTFLRKQPLLYSLRKKKKERDWFKFRMCHSAAISWKLLDTSCEEDLVFRSHIILAWRGEANRGRSGLISSHCALNQRREHRVSYESWVTLSPPCLQPSSWNGAGHYGPCLFHPYHVLCLPFACGKL